MDWAKSQRRNLYPNKVRFATWNLAWNRAYWFCIERVLNPVLAAQFEAEAIDRRTIRVEARNIAAYKLALSDRLLDPRQPITVVTDGQQSYAGPFKPELRIELAPRRWASSSRMPRCLTRSQPSPWKVLTTPRASWPSPHGAG